MVIAIGGEYGSGAKYVAKLAAERYGFILCDDKYIANAVRETGILSDESAYKHYDESEGDASIGEIKRVSSINKSGYHYATTPVKYEALPLDQRIAQTQGAVLNKLADGDDCIILGHCADYYLKDRDDVVRVWAYSDLDKRIARTAEHFNISEKDAKKRVLQNDKRRAEYYSYFTNQKWNDITNYDILLNIDSIGIQRCVQMLHDFTNLKWGSLKVGAGDDPFDD